MCGNDNHGTAGISRNVSRTFVLAKEPTKAAILDAMKNRRTYAAFNNIQCRYAVNGAVMGSTLNREKIFKFDILVSDPDSSNPKDAITKIDIVKDGGVVVKDFQPSPGYLIHWTPAIEDSSATYFLVRVGPRGAARPREQILPSPWHG